MKLRIKGNSMRLRVSRSELGRLLNGDRLEETIQFAAAPEARLSYALQARQQEMPVQLEWSPQKITVSVSEDCAIAWGSDGEVGIYESLPLGPAGDLEIVLEKDFACLDRNEEENADTFPNPNAPALCK